MIEVFEFTISKTDLAAMPERERHALILCGHACNQLSALMKIVIVLANHDGKPGIEEKVSGAQTQVVLRFLFGALAETWEMVTKRIKSTPEGKQLLPKLNDTGRDALSRLNKQFGNSSLLHDIRNSVAFHFPDDSEMREAFEATPTDDDMWKWYLSDANANSFYFLNEMVVGHGLIKATGESDLIQAFSKVMTNAMAATNDLLDFLQSYLRVLVGEHWPEILDQRNVVLTVTTAPNITAFKVPFYYERAPDSNTDQ